MTEEEECDAMDKKIQDLKIVCKALQDKLQRLDRPMKDRGRAEEMVLIENTQCQDVVNAIEWTSIKNYRRRQMKTEIHNLRAIVDEIRDRYRELDTRSWDMERGLNYTVERLELSVKDLDNKLKVSEESRQLLETENMTLKNQLEDIKKSRNSDMNDTIQHLESDEVKQKSETEDNNNEEEAEILDFDIFDNYRQFL